MKKMIKSLWGCIPLVIVLLCIAIVAIIQTTGITLRSIPRSTLICFGVVSLWTFLIWGNRRLSAFKKDKVIFSIVALILNGFIAVFIIISCLMTIFFISYSYTPEHIVTKYNIKMVARVESFLDETVYYYEYKNPFFYGQNLGYEYYGSGGRDPLATTPSRKPIHWYFYDLNGNIIDFVSAEGITEKHD